MKAGIVELLQPEAISLYSALLMLVSSVLIRERNVQRFLFVFLAALVLASSVLVPPSRPFGFEALNLDSFAVTARMFVSIIFLTVSFFLTSSKVSKKLDGRFYSLAFFSLFGSFLLFEVSNLVALLISLEVSSIAAYAIAGYFRTKRELEASTKYFLFGALASALFVFGLAVLSSGAKDVSYGAVGAFLSAPFYSGPLGYIGLFLVLSAFSYKIAVFPWHMYAPDFYEGQSLPALVFNASVPKSAGLLALVAFLRHLPVTAELYLLVIATVFLTWLYTNLSAVVEKNIYRIVAFSSISHAAFVLLSLILAYPEVERVSLLYVFAYGISTAGLIGSLIQAGNGRAVQVSDLKGFAKDSPLASFLFAVSVLSLAGIPPLPVFFGKYYLLSELVAGGFAGMAITGAIFSAVALGYYLKLLRTAFLEERASARREAAHEGTFLFALSFNLLLQLFFFVYSALIFRNLPHG